MCRRFEAQTPTGHQAERRVPCSCQVPELQYHTLRLPHQKISHFYHELSKPVQVFMQGIRIRGERAWGLQWYRPGLNLLLTTVSLCFLTSKVRIINRALTRLLYRKKMWAKAWYRLVPHTWWLLNNPQYLKGLHAKAKSSGSYKREVLFHFMGGDIIDSFKGFSKGCTKTGRAWVEQHDGRFEGKQCPQDWGLQTLHRTQEAALEQTCWDCPHCCWAVRPGRFT